MKLGWKIGGGFSLLIIIALVLGGLAVISMKRVETSSVRLSQEYVPEVGVANNLERNYQQAMLLIRSYALSEDRAYLAEGRKELAEVKQYLAEAKALADKSPHLAKLKASVGQVTDKLAEYEKLINETEALDDARDDTRKIMDEAAQAFMMNVNEYLGNQEKELAGELSAGLTGEKLRERTTKVKVINDLLGRGYEIRLANFKAQALNAPEFLKKGLELFKFLDSASEDLRKITHQAHNLKLVDQTQASGHKYKAAMASLLKNIQAMEEIGKKRTAVANQALDLIKATAHAGMSQMTKMAEEAVSALALASLVMFIGLGVALVIGLVLAVIITRTITRPVGEVLLLAQGLHNGDLTIPDIDHRRRDELGRMAAALNAMKNNLRENVVQIVAGSQTIATASNQVSTGSQDLAQRTQEQASAVEETAATLEEMTSSVKQNADNADLANDLAARTSRLAGEGGQVIDKAVQAMLRVTESSQQINEIIDAVNEIAFQTNLLALNAAVEAARAGEAGKGFAVVAGEVRNLAQRSAEEAKRIQALIKESVNRVAEGSQLVNQSGETLRTIIGDVARVAETITEITASSREQAHAIDEINKAMAQMDEAVQQNAALVEETASAAETMASEAHNLQDMMARFKVDGVSGRATPARRAKGGPPAKPKALPEPKPDRQAKPAEPTAAQAKPAGGKDDFFDAEELEGFEKF